MDDEPVGAILGRYRIEHKLGAGAMGIVHAAFDLDLERRIALKVLRATGATPGANGRLMREARVMARLAHPNVVTVHEVGTAGGRGFVAMELIQGETLAEWLAAGKRPLAAILDAFLAAGRGLAAAHAAGIVHRDFKPRNVLRARGGRIVVTDFGLAREVEAAPAPALVVTSPIDVGRSKLTATGSLLGTPAYMAPEQWCGGSITPATDQFAYCVALWEAITGERPYHGSSAKALRAHMARGTKAVNVGRIPRHLRGALCRGLDPDPARRWPSMTALLERLGCARRRRGIVLEIARTALIVMASLFGVWRCGERPDPVSHLPGTHRTYPTLGARTCCDGRPARPESSYHGPWERRQRPARSMKVDAPRITMRLQRQTTGTRLRADPPARGARKRELAIGSWLARAAPRSWCTAP